MHCNSCGLVSSDWAGSSRRDYFNVGEKSIGRNRHNAPPKKALRPWACTNCKEPFTSRLASSSSLVWSWSLNWHFQPSWRRARSNAVIPSHKVDTIHMPCFVPIVYKAALFCNAVLETFMYTHTSERVSE